ncbi:hypothetical protein H6P81_020782 [Aristolochia fimbriata]|uniref:VQ domain-containing protein n=1 Tax=Aristolochia fimbriata TaxID=158543 RepID=A0AAV7DVE2_ARIFI|nr:hypothetical protein H6P81_020782 [Aristolochia fimbriata]
MVKQTSENPSSVNVPAHEQWLRGPENSSPAPSRRRNYEVPPKVYTVHPREFRRLVQRLTGAPPAPRRQRLRAVAPPSLPVDRWQHPHPHPQAWPVANALQVLQEMSSPSWLQQQHSVTERKRVPEDNPVENAFSGFLSPSSHSPWMLLSPGTMATLEYGAAL